MAVHRCHGRVYSGSHVVRLLPLEANHRRKQQWQPAVVIKTASTKQRTMESVRSAFHAQLATVMDSLLAAAVCEIAKIFESSLCEQQAELAQKTEELSILRCKLEKVERRQKAKGGGSEEGEMSSGDREGSLRQQTLTGSGITAVFVWFKLVHEQLNLVIVRSSSSYLYLLIPLSAPLNLLCSSLCRPITYWISARDGYKLQFSRTGLNMGKDVSSHSDPVEGVSQSLGKLKEEVNGQDGASVKHEVRPSPASVSFRSCLFY